MLWWDRVAPLGKPVVPEVQPPAAVAEALPAGNKAANTEGEGGPPVAPAIAAAPADPEVPLEDTLHLGEESDWPETRTRLLALPGFGPWTADVIAMRALGDPDAFLPTDLGVRRAARHLGLPSTPAALTAHAEPWHPWRAYAVQYLWSTDDHPINSIPA